MFRLTAQEARAILVSRSQTVTLKRGQNIKYLPHAFTEQGVAMLSSVLRSPRAAQELERDVDGAAVDQQVLADDEASVRAAQERARPAELLGGAEAVRGHLGHARA